MSDKFQLLDKTIQKWVYKQGWQSLRDIQEKSIEPILSANSDVVISASTAAGKTEAAFLPACTKIAGRNEGFGIIYISPLKALINDQYRRLEELSDMLGMKVTAWHGDSLQSKKKDAKRFPEGVLLITPESLESLLIREPGWVKSSFNSLEYIIIDEYHAFIGFERGCHLQSLMARLESLLDRQETTPIPRIALSATLGDMNGVLRYLRPNKSIPCKLIEGHESQGSLKMQVRGYVDKIPFEDDDENTETADLQIARELFDYLRGDSHLVFANSRRRTEKFASLLRDLSEKNIVPNEFFPHHGSLSKELRQELESRLQKEHLPTTAICTMTLELGIDIGKVKSVCQVTAPHSVASLRQRLGRSGRRGDSAILRMFIAENELHSVSPISDLLRLELLQSIAMLRLLVGEKWYEPADISLFHFSTLFHQILAVISQWGAVRADQLWSLLCKTGTFDNVTINHLKKLLSDMGEKHLITQLSSGELVLGDEGEKLVDHYTFYAVFKTPEEYRILYKARTLGTIPIDDLIIKGQNILFSGKKWIVQEVDSDKKIIQVIPGKGGKPPRFGGGSMSVHDRVRQEMLNVLKDGSYLIKKGDQSLDFLDPIAKNLFLESLRYFQESDLKNNRIIGHGNHVYIIPWIGDKIVNTLNVILVRHGYKVDSFGGIIEIENTNKTEIIKIFENILNEKNITNADLAEIIENRDFKQTEKYDYLLPIDILNEGYGAKTFDIEGTRNWLSIAFEKNYF